MKTAVIFSGAGLSADSGIQTFRGSKGMWEEHDIMEVAEHQAWYKNKELVLEFYKTRFEKYSDVKPHKGHEAIAKLQEKFHVVNVTQNIDDLLEQAGCKNVRHLHGKLKWAKCEWHKDIQNNNDAFKCDFKIPIDEPIKMGDKCPQCDGQLRPNVVWFNEAVEMPYDYFRGLIETIKYNDGVFISVGTSLEVSPAALIVPWFSQVSRKYFVDPYLQQFRVSEYELISETAVKGIPKLVDHLLKEEDDAG